jgi:hypothetical protein
LDIGFAFEALNSSDKKVSVKQFASNIIFSYDSYQSSVILNYVYKENTFVKGRSWGLKKLLFEVRGNLKCFIPAILF